MEEQSVGSLIKTELSLSQNKPKKVDERNKRNKVTWEHTAGYLSRLGG